MLQERLWAVPRADSQRRRLRRRKLLSEPIAILGATGQIGRALLRSAGSRALALSRPEFDLSRPADLERALDRLIASRPICALINAAAYTQVDRAESEGALARRINGEAPSVLSRWASAKGIPFVHYSTDYVFSGAGSRPWNEEDETAPLNAYGRSKLEGERGVREPGGAFLILRTSWVYDASGANFLNTMLRLGGERESLGVVDDQVGAPSFAGDLAQATLSALEQAMRSGEKWGIYHLTNSGETSWHGFAHAIFEEARALGRPLKLRELRPIGSAEFPTPAARPANSRLSNALFKRSFGFELRPWREALHACMREKFGS